MDNPLKASLARTNALMRAIAREYGIKMTTVRRRIDQGWSLEKALTTEETTMAVETKDLGKWRTNFPAAGIVPEGLVKRLDHIATWEPADSPRAIAIKEAADALRNLPVKLRDSVRLEDERFHVKSYRIDTNVEAKEMRIVYFGEHSQKNVVATLTFNSGEAYEHAQLILKNYDRLEGIK